MTCSIGSSGDCIRGLRERNRWRLYRELEEGRVDPWILPLLSTLWSLGAVTTSSCSGRIAVKTSGSIWEKRGSKILASWHEPVVAEAVRGALEKALLGGETSRVVWLSVEPPFVTMYVEDEDSASFITDAAVEVGFKYACYRRGECGYYVVIRGEERLNVLLVLEGKRLLRSQELDAVIREANRLLERGRSRLESLRLKLALML